MRPTSCIRPAASVIVGSVLSLLTTAVLAQEPTADPGEIVLQTGFDHIGAEVHMLESGGRQLHYIDEGEEGWRPVVFIGGLGTSLAAFQLTEFAQTSRETLGLRMISVERNGFGESDFDPDRGYAGYTEDVLAVLDHLGIEDFAILAISGGGAFAAHLAAEVPDRVISLHAAAAVSWTLPTREELDCSRSLEEWNEVNARWTENPKDWWGVPGSPVLVVPGWQTAAYADVTRAFYLGGQMGDPSALSREFTQRCDEDAIADVDRITPPVYLYWGDEDTVVPMSVMEQWQAAVPEVRRTRVYEGAGHTVQYEHWVQIMADMAGYDDFTVVCRDGETRLVPEDEAGDLPRDLCAWHEAD
jgi:non-heme chloroperoxidase